MVSSKAVGVLTIINTGLCFVTLVCHIVGFSFPNWLESKPGLSTFKSIGLHEVCFDNYMHDEDPNRAYYGCRYYWEYYLRELKIWLNPAWFEFVRLLEILSLVFMIIALLNMIGCCLCLFWGRLAKDPRVKNIVLQLLLYLAAIIFIVTGLLIIVALAIFEMNAFTREWVPRPDVNVLAFCYHLEVACAVFVSISGIMALMTAIFQTLHIQRLRIPSMADDMALGHK